MQNLKSTQSIHPVQAGLVKIRVIERSLCSAISIHARHTARAYSGQKLYAKQQSDIKMD